MIRSDATRGRALPLAVTDFLCAATFALVSLIGDISFAATRSWDGGAGADTDWTTGANWDVFNTVPSDKDIAHFDRGAAFNYSVTFPFLSPLGGDISTDRLIVGSNAVTFEPDHSNTDYFAGTSITDELGRGIIIGEEANDAAAALTSHLGLLSTAAATLGHVAGSSGTLTLNQNNDQFNVTSNTALALIIGRQGTGVLNVSGGADVNITGGLNLGLLGGSGTLTVASGATVNSSTSHMRNGAATVTGTNSSWNSGPLDLGASGLGTLNVSDGGSVIASGFQVGTPGNGSVNVTSGGVLSTTNTQIGSGNLIGSGVVTISGAGSTWTNGNSGAAPLVLGGMNGPGTINVSDGGRFTNAIPGVVHVLHGGASVDGVGSSWSAFYTLVSATMIVSNGGTVNGIVSVAGTLKGNGNIAGNVDSQGVVAPGDSLGALNIIGGLNEYAQQASGSLQIELGGTTPGSEYDQLLVDGNIKLNGTLEVSLISSFSPALGNSFNILDWGGTRTGQFVNVNLPTLSGSLGWDASQLYTTGVLSVILLGDYNKNGIVDAADYLVWRKTDGTPTGYNLWRTHLGQTAGSGAGASANAVIPEPANLILLMLAAAGWGFRRRRNA